MSQAKLFDLINRLHRQHPVGEVDADSSCPQCGEPSHTGDLCADCLVKELEEITGDGYHPERYRTQLALQVWHLRQMVERTRITPRLRDKKIMERHQKANHDRMVEEMRRTGADRVGERGTRGRGGQDISNTQQSWAKRWGIENL